MVRLHKAGGAHVPAAARLRVGGCGQGLGKGRWGRASATGKSLDLLLSEMRDHSSCCVEKTTWDIKVKSKEAVTQPPDYGSSYQGSGGTKKGLNPEYILEVGPTGFADGLVMGVRGQKGRRQGRLHMLWLGHRKGGAATN